MAPLIFGIRKNIALRAAFLSGRRFAVRHMRLRNIFYIGRRYNPAAAYNISGLRVFAGRNGRGDCAVAGI